MANIQEVAGKISPAAAQIALARVFAALGSEYDWDSRTLDAIVEAISFAHPEGCPSAWDQDEKAIAFWREVAEL